MTESTSTSEEPSLELTALETRVDGLYNVWADDAGYFIAGGNRWLSFFERDVQEADQRHVRAVATVVVDTILGAEVLSLHEFPKLTTPTIRSRSDIYFAGDDGLWHLNASGLDFLMEWTGDLGPYGFSFAGWAAPNGEVFLGGDDGILRGSGAGPWQVQELGEYAGGGCGAIHGQSVRDVFALGGHVLHFDGKTWRSVGHSPGGSDLWSPDPNEVIEVGEKGLVRWFDGTQWKSMPSSTTNDLRAISGTNRNDIYAVGEAGTLLHFDGNEWSTIPTGRTETLYDVFVTKGGRIVISGENGLILYGRQTPE